MNFLNKRIAWLTQAFFVLSMISGAIIVFAYYPSNAYDSVQKINYIIPFGSFFRELHYFSSEVFLVVLILHIAMELYKKDIKISFSSWNYATFATLAVFILMFTGFVLKADQSANAAAQVAFSLISDTPVLDNLLPLFKDTQVFYWKFFIWHIIFLPLFLTFVIYKHVKRISADKENFTIAIGATLLLALIISMPVDVPLEENVKLLKGPWFFWGAENLLQIGINSIGVNIILLMPFIFLLFIYITDYKKSFKFLLLLWVLIYAYFSI